MKLLLTVIFLGFSLVGLGQHVIRGHITDKEGKRVGEVICTVSDVTGAFLGFTISESDGTYSVEVAQEADSVLLNVSCMGYAPQQRKIKAVSGVHDFEMEEKALVLKEVTVKSAPIWRIGDTLNYSLTEFAGKEDRVMGDVLQKLPGVEVSADGGIKYQGKAINRFYIEGLNLLDGQYSLATRNLPISVVDGIQVLENHQPVQALKDITISEQAAINIKLKKDKVMLPAGTVEGGGGERSDEGELWLGKLFALQAASNRQTAGIVKGCNTGENVVNELKEHALTLDYVFDPGFDVPEDMFDAPTLGVSSITEGRYLDNRAMIASLNNIWRINKDKQLRLNVAWAENRESQEAEKIDDWWVDDSVIHIDDVQRSLLYTHRGEAKLTFTNNTKKTFVNNELKGIGQWNRADAAFRGTTNLEEDIDLPLFIVQNKLELVRNHGEKAQRYNSFVRYGLLPQELTLSDTSGDFGQKSRHALFYTENYTSFILKLKKQIFSLEAKFCASIDDINTSALNGRYAFVGDNRMRYNRMDYLLTPEWGYRSKNQKFNSTLSCPVSLVEIHTRRPSGNYVRFVALPKLYLSHEFNNYFKVRGSYHYSQSFGDAADFAVAARMSDHQTFTQGSGVLEKRGAHNFSGYVSYRRPIESIFAYFSSIYRFVHSNVIGVQQYEDLQVIYSHVLRANDSKQLMLSASLKKYFGSLKMNVSLNGGYSRYQNTRVQQNKELTVTSETQLIGLAMDYKPTAWSCVVMNGEVNTSHNVSPLTPRLSTYHATGKLYVFPYEFWEIRFSAEYMRSDISSDDYVSLRFADISTKLKTGRWETTFSWRNIFDQRSYGYALYDGMNFYSYTFRLRPEEVMATVTYSF